MLQIILRLTSAHLSPNMDDAHSRLRARSAQAAVDEDIRTQAAS